MRLLVDTQVLIWYVVTPEKLSRIAADELTAETAADVPIGVSGHALVEIAYAVEKAKNSLTSEDADDPRSPPQRSLAVRGGAG